jgi:Flp pilus assembly protein CpaB
MKERGLVVVLAFLLAIGATAAVFLYVNGVKSSATTGGTTTNVIVSKQTIPAGTGLDALVSSGAFVTKSIPTDDVVPGATTSIQQLQGKTTSSTILAGEQIPIARVTGTEAGGPLAIPKGMQAETFQLSAAEGVSGHVFQSSHIAIYATFDGASISGKSSPPAVTGGSGGSGGETVTVDLVPDVQVLDVIRPEAKSTTSSQFLVTLALTPQDAQRLAYTLDQGRVWVALLPPGEQGKSQKPIDLADVVK